MIKIRMIGSDEIVEVTKNVAHGLIDSGKAILYQEYKSKPLSPSFSKERKRGRYSIK